MTDGGCRARQGRREPRAPERRATSRRGHRQDDLGPDSRLDRFLAYFSYYVLVFTAACIFMPVQTANALSYARYAVTANAKMTTAPVPFAQWDMRGSLR